MKLTLTELECFTFDLNSAHFNTQFFVVHSYKSNSHDIYHGFTYVLFDKDLFNDNIVRIYYWHLLTGCLVWGDPIVGGGTENWEGGTLWPFGIEDGVCLAGDSPRSCRSNSSAVRTFGLRSKALSISSRVWAFGSMIEADLEWGPLWDSGVSCK